MRVFKLILVDLDGTMLDRSHRVTAEAMEAVRLAHEASIEISVATGRAYPAAAHIIRQLGIRVPFICAGGATIRCLERDVIQDRILDPSVYAEVLAHVPPDLDIVVFTSDNGFAKRLSEGVLKYAAALGMNFVEKENLASLSSSVRVVALRGSPERVTPLCMQLSRRLCGCAEVERVLPHLLEIRAKDATKHHAMCVLAKAMGIGTDEIVAIGDGLGDQGMVRASGFGVAVSNAVDELKSVANYVTTAPYSEGVLETVRDIVAGKLPKDSRNSE
ncbi:MAG TPA: HAD family phosphatase [Firmicutes bacterium]|nr:HAD family phosphatase [Bacillota bacterium]